MCSSGYTPFSDLYPRTFCAPAAGGSSPAVFTAHTAASVPGAVIGPPRRRCGRSSPHPCLSLSMRYGTAGLRTAGQNDRWGPASARAHRIGQARAETQGKAAAALGRNGAGPMRWAQLLRCGAFPEERAPQNAPPAPRADGKGSSQLLPPGGGRTARHAGAKARQTCPTRHPGWILSFSAFHAASGLLQRPEAGEEEPAAPLPAARLVLWWKARKKGWLPACLAAVVPGKEIKRANCMPTGCCGS